MTIRDQLRSELRDAMKTGDKARRDVIRMIETEVNVAKSEPGFSGEADDGLYTAVIAGYVKRMEKARSEYGDLGDRGEEMAAKLGYEVEYLGRWLPEKLDETATASLVDSAIAELGVSGDEKAAGRVIGHLMKSHKDDLDGGLVNRLVRERLSAS